MTVASLCFLLQRCKYAHILTAVTCLHLLYFGVHRVTLSLSFVAKIVCGLSVLLSNFYAHFHVDIEGNSNTKLLIT